MIEADVLLNDAVQSLAASQAGVCILDSCGVGPAGSNLLIAGVAPVRALSISDRDPRRVLRELDSLLRDEQHAVIFTLSYDLGLDLNGMPGDQKSVEPQLFAAVFDGLVIHDHDRGVTRLAGEPMGILRLAEMIAANTEGRVASQTKNSELVSTTSNFSREEYIDSVERIRELIRSGETYQANLTQQLTVRLPSSLTPADVFLNLRRDHPAAFTAYLDRGDSTVVSASPELFFRVEAAENRKTVLVAPIKGTRPRGSTAAEDEALRRELLASAKDRAENTMIVDLMRNDLGRVCEFGSVRVEELCRLDEHPTLFHLVSAVRGTLRSDVLPSDLISALFPCGSITGAPKIRTMEILQRLETRPRGLSMGAIGCYVPGRTFGAGEIFEMSVAIRTMVIRDGIATFNVGGGIVIDSDPESEYAESLLKAKALFRALGVRDLPARGTAQRGIGPRPGSFEKSY